MLKRAIRACWITRDEMDLLWILVKKSWDENLKPLGKRYLGDPEAARRAAEAVANQASAKP